MSQAKVLSTDVLVTLRAALLKYHEQASNALGAAANEVRRSQEHLQERTKYWTREIQRRQEQVARARSDLSFAKSMRDGSGTGTSEQEIQLKKATARLKEAEEKLQLCKRWAQQLPDLLREYDARVRQMGNFLEVDLPKGAAFLAGRTAALDAYLATQPPPAVKPAPESESSS